MSKLLYGLGASIAIVFISLGIACLVVNGTSHPIISCGKNGSPPLQQWVLGSGIGYTIFGILFTASFIFMVVLDNMACGFNPFTASTLITTIIGFAFTFSWTIIGGVSLWGNGMDCYYTSSSVWMVSTATIIISLVEMVIFGILIVPTISTL